MGQDEGRVRQRRVFYIPGYDPHPARRYRELYRKEAGLQARISGYRITVKGETGAGRGTWVAQMQQDGRGSAARFTVLTWSDIVQRSMRGGVLATYMLLLRTLWIYLRSGALWRLMRLRKGPVIAALYPAVMLSLQLSLAVLLAAISANWVFAASAGGLTPGWQAIVWGLAVGAFGLIFVGVLGLFRGQDRWLFAYYLMHDYGFSASAAGAYPAPIAARIDAFQAQITGALSDGDDEVLIVGHSSGAHLAVSVLAGMLRAGVIKADGPAISLLTLGQVAPMLSFLPRAFQLRDDLATLHESEAVAWVDVSAPGDGGCFALCDPVAVTGLAQPGRRWPLILSAAFRKTLSPARWGQMRWRFFRLHFQYLCAFDRPGDYDYFQITAGPLTLAKRFGGRGHSRSRISQPRSAYTSRSP